METLCGPYSASLGIKHKCYSQFYLVLVPAVFWICVFLSECVLKKRLKAFPGKVPGLLLGLLCLVIGGYFVLLSLELFYIDIPNVALIDVITYLVEVSLWMLVMYVYQRSYNPQSWGFTSYASLRLFYIVQSAVMLFQFILWISNFGNPQELLSGEVLNEDVLLTWLQLWPWVADGLLMGYLVSGWVAARSSWVAAQYQSLAASPPHWFDGVSIYSKLTIMWINSLMFLGRLRPLTQNDLDELRPEEEVSEHDKRFKEQLDLYLHKPDIKRPILRAIYGRFKAEIIRITMFGIITTMMDYIGSFYILVVANYLTSDQPTWRGYVLVSYLLLFKIIQGVSNTQFRFQVQLFSLHLRAAISTQIYKKSLKAATIATKASGEATEKTSYAQVTNLMQVDLERLSWGLPYSLRAAVFPFQIGIGIYMMFITIGTPGSIASLSTMVVLFLINGICSKKAGSLMKLMMEKKDGRMKYCVELLANIKVLKMYNWEQKIVDRIGTARAEEIRVTWKVANLFNFLIFLNWGSRSYLIIAIVVTMSILGEPLSPGHIFAGITVIGILNMCIRFVPEVLNNFIQMLVSMKRIEDYLKSAEVQEYNDKEKGKQAPEVAVSLVDASFSWSTSAPSAEVPASSGGELPELRLALQDVTLSIRKGEFVAIVGRVGSGKSSLLQGLIGNMNFIKRSPDSHMFINGSIAYVSQEAWIQNLTIKDNVLFGNPMDMERYQAVLDVCELNNDLQILPGGDLTEIGEKGINLSGGQKARVAIARAVYSDADVLLMDDPLSALDAHVGKSIYSQCLSQFCAGKTRILTTHGQQYLPSVDRIIVINEGKVVEIGTYQELLALDGYFKNEFLVKAHDDETGFVSTGTEVKEESGKEKTESKIIETEDKAVGSVSFRVYKDYYNYMGGWKILTAILISMLLWQGSRMYADIYLSEWTEESPEKQNQMVITNNLIFGIASMVLNLFILVRLRLTTHSAIHASQVIFSKVITALADAPVNKYYDITPNGRILNRLSKDQGMIDTMIIMMIGGFIGQAFTVVLVISMCAYAIPYLLLLIPVLVYISLKVQKLYLSSSRELTRLESISRSPILQLFSETVSGAPAIRAFEYQSRFIERNTMYLNENMKISFYLASVNAWLTMFLELISDLVLCICAFAIVSFRGNMGVGMAGMALSYALSLPENFYWLVFTSAGMENAMVSVERTDALTRIISEQPRVRHKDEQLIARNWPERGQISFNNFQLKYRDETDLVLFGITADIQSHEKIGIVGRTGSGKSSLCLALFRIVEGYAGNITIDGVDISEVGLDLLRQKMSVIPQDPTLFRGKLRDNFDPFHTVSDEFLLQSITDLNMFPDKNLQDVLKMDVQENGENFSVGERQLICILRAILRHTKIMFLDEATASIDYRTDQLIQSIIRERFQECTVLTIAHRINTIMDYDRVMVMDKGVIVEFDKPNVLRAQDSYFSRLVAQSRL